MLQNLGIQMTANARNKHTQIEDGLPTEDRDYKSQPSISRCLLNTQPQLWGEQKQ